VLNGERLDVEPDDARAVVQGVVLDDDVDVVKEVGGFMVLVPTGNPPAYAVMMYCSESTIDAAGRLSMIQLLWYSSLMIDLRDETSALFRVTWHSTLQNWSCSMKSWNAEFSIRSPDKNSPRFSVACLMPPCGRQNLSE